MEEGPIQFDEDPNEEIKEEVGEVIEFADEGEALVIRRNLSSIQKEEENWLRENLFLYSLHFTWQGV